MIRKHDKKVCMNTMHDGRENKMYIEIQAYSTPCKDHRATAYGQMTAIQVYRYSRWNYSACTTETSKLYNEYKTVTEKRVEKVNTANTTYKTCTVMHWIQYNRITSTLFTHIDEKRGANTANTLITMVATIEQPPQQIRLLPYIPYTQIVG